jgi:hypothetical protein
MRKVVLIAALLASTPALAAFADVDLGAARKAQDACYDKADLALDACTKKIDGLSMGAMNVCDRAHTNAKSDCDQLYDPLLSPLPAHFDSSTEDVGYAPDKDGKCQAGDALNTLNRCRDGAVFAQDPCYSGPKNQFNQASCDKQIAEKAASDARYEAQAEASKAQDRQNNLNACNKLPTTYGVMMCRWGV